MQLLCLFQLLLFAHTVTPSLVSDTWSRNTAMGDEDTWFPPSISALETRKSNSGGLVDRDVTYSRGTWATTNHPPLPEDVRAYVVRAKEGTDHEKMKKFLESQTKRPSEVYPIGVHVNEVTGWGNVILDPAGKSAVENYEGLDGMTEYLPPVSLQSEPAHEEPQHLEDQSTSFKRDMNSQNTPEPNNHNSPLDKRAAGPCDIEIYTAVLAEGGNAAETEKFLKSKISGDGMYQIGLGDDIIGWDHIVLTSDAKSEVEKYKGIGSMGKQKIVTFHRALPASNSSQPSLEASPIAAKHGKLRPRASSWKKVATGDDALLMDSQYPGAEIDELNYFVYPDNPGSHPNVYVYVIDRGVEVNVKNSAGEREFRIEDKPNKRVIQTWVSYQAGENPLTDDNVKPSHGTMAASKAVGSGHGLAKEAILKSVKLVDQPGEFTNALNYVLKDLKDHPNRQGRSVVLTAMSVGSGETHQKSKDDFKDQQLYGEPIRQLFKLGVPLVCSSGNDVEPEQRQEVDALPMVLEDEENPIIIVGAADYDGRRLDSSQKGDHVTIYAPGKDVLSQIKTDGRSEKSTGTSVAAPQVAGLIATYLSYQAKPWDDSKTGVERVKAIREYLISDKSSWIRDGGATEKIRMIWNGATKDDHDDAENVSDSGSDR